MDSTRRIAKDRRENALIWTLFAIVMVASLIPALIGLLLSMQAYRPMLGLSGSPWVGFANYEGFLASPYAARIVRNSLTLSLLGLALGLGLGAAAALAVSNLKAGAGRRIAMATLLLPVFVPQIVWARMGIRWLPNQWLIAPGQYILGYLSMSVMPLAGWTGFFGAWMGTRGRLREGLGWCALMGLFLCLTPQAELLQLTMSPATYEVADVLDTYTYRSGMLQMEYGWSAAAQAVKMLGQVLAGGLALAAVAAILRRRETHALDMPQGRPVREGRLSPLVWLIPVLALWAGTTVLWLVMDGQGGGSVGAQLLQGLPSQLLATLATAAFSWAVAMALIRGMSGLGRAGMWVCALLLLAVRSTSMGGYILMRTAGWINTIFPIILTSLWTPMGMLLTVSCACLVRALPGTRAGRRALIPAAYAAAQAWGGTLQMQYTTGSQWRTYGVIMREAMNGGQAGVGLYAAVLLPVLAIGGVCAWAALRDQEA